jgi:hypothetical protein
MIEMADEQNFKKKPRKLVYQIRMNEDESVLLDMISYETDDTKANVIRKALKMYASAKRNGF